MWKGDINKYFRWQNITLTVYNGNHVFNRATVRARNVQICHFERAIDNLTILLFQYQDVLSQKYSCPKSKQNVYHLPAIGLV